MNSHTKIKRKNPQLFTPANARNWIILNLDQFRTGNKIDKLALERGFINNFGRENIVNYIKRKDEDWLPTLINETIEEYMYRLQHDVRKNPNKQNRKRKNPYTLTENNLRRWAFLYLLHYKPINETSISDAATDAARQLTVKYYDKDWVIKNLTAILKFWLTEWLKFTKNEKFKTAKEKENLWRDFIFNIDMPIRTFGSNSTTYFWDTVDLYNQYPQTPVRL